MNTNKDFLDKLIAERTKQNPDFPALVEAAIQRRKARRTPKSQNGSVVSSHVDTSKDEIAPAESTATRAE